MSCIRFSQNSDYVSSFRYSKITRVLRESICARFCSYKSGFIYFAGARFGTRGAYFKLRFSLTSADAAAVNDSWTTTSVSTAPFFLIVNLNHYVERVPYWRTYISQVDFPRCASSRSPCLDESSGSCGWGWMTGLECSSMSSRSIYVLQLTYYFRG